MGFTYFFEKWNHSEQLMIYILHNVSLSIYKLQSSLLCWGKKPLLSSCTLESIVKVTPCKCVIEKWHRKWDDINTSHKICNKITKKFRNSCL